MLVLSRNVGEKVMISVPPSDKDTVIEVTLVEARGQKCRMGYDAPRQVAIHRKEIYDVMRKDKEQAKDGESNQAR